MNLYKIQAHDDNILYIQYFFSSKILAVLAMYVENSNSLEICNFYLINSHSIA